MASIRRSWTSGVVGRSAPSMMASMMSAMVYSSIPRRSFPSAVRSTASSTSLPTCRFNASAVPSFAPITAWLMSFSRLASSWASLLTAKSCLVGGSGSNLSAANCFLAAAITMSAVMATVALTPFTGLGDCSHRPDIPLKFPQSPVLITSSSNCFAPLTRR